MNLLILQHSFVVGNQGITVMELQSVQTLCEQQHLICGGSSQSQFLPNHVQVHLEAQF